MLSILIPVYNYNISCLVAEMHKQATTVNIDFEIICFNDNSNKFVNENNTTIAKLSNTTLITSEVNLGRTAARQQLCNASKYNWLLFLDADVLPKRKTFLKQYLSKISSGYDAFFGGFAYTEEQPNKKSILRWKYGKKFEEVDADKRNKKPHQLIISANFLIKKVIFNTINSKINRKSYGLDNYFASLLKQHNIKVFHLNNEVYHLGLETSNTYLKKTEEAIATLLWAFKHQKMSKHDQKLLSLFEKIKKTRFNYIMAFFYKISNTIIKKNLVSSNPNLYVLQFYKLLFICYKELN